MTACYSKNVICFRLSFSPPPPPLVSVKRTNATKLISAVTVVIARDYYFSGLTFTTATCPPVVSSSPHPRKYRPGRFGVFSAILGRVCTTARYVEWKSETKSSHSHAYFAFVSFLSSFAHSDPTASDASRER